LLTVEFIVLHKDCGLEEAKQVAEKVRSAIENYNFGLGNDHAIVTISLGVAAYMLNETPENFFTRTDKALYLAKEKGRNRLEG
jgi:diguanylate cyclase (GGDEF)-like protein